MLVIYDLKQYTPFLVPEQKHMTCTGHTRWSKALLNCKLSICMACIQLLRSFIQRPPLIIRVYVDLTSCKFGNVINPLVILCFQVVRNVQGFTLAVKMIDHQRAELSSRNKTSFMIYNCWFTSLWFWKYWYLHMYHKFLQKSKTSLYSYENHKDGSNQRLNRHEAKDRNHDMKAIAADILYLLQNFGMQYGPFTWSRMSTTLAVEHAAARVRIDNTCWEKCWDHT